MKTPTQYTLVQHSAYGFRRDYRFWRAVEVRAVSTASGKAKVKKAGGQLFRTYKEADDAEYAENYPKKLDKPRRPIDMQLIPRVQGHFATAKIDGLRIYIPFGRD